MPDERDIGGTSSERPSLGFGFAALLAVLLSLPLWGGILWVTRLVWRSLTDMH
jgi:hypothetical protein